MRRFPDQVERIEAASMPIEVFAALVDCSVEECREMGYERWAKRVLEARVGILGVLAFKTVTQLGLGQGKMFCARVDHNPGPFLDEVGPALAARDVGAIASLFRRHYTFDEPEPAVRFAEALVRAFATP